MYTILMADDKMLVSTESRKVYQRDSFVGKDTLQFIIPSSLGGDKNEEGKYEPDIRDDCSVILTYKDPSNVVKTVVLNPQIDIIEIDGSDDVYYKYYLPIGTDLTKFAGNVGLSLTILNTSSNFALHSSEYILFINPLPAQYAVLDQESVESTMEKINQIGIDLEKTKATIPNDLVEEDNFIKLSIDGQSIGDGVEMIDAGENLDAIDGAKDGIIDLDEDGNADTGNISNDDEDVPVIDLDEEGNEEG